MLVITVRGEGVCIAKDDLRSRTGLECILVVVNKDKLRCFGYVQRMDEGPY